MEIKVTRETVRSIRLDASDAEGVRVRQSWGEAMFVPDLLIETWVEGPISIGTRRYSISLKGRVLTGKGALHATRRAERTWSGETALKAYAGEHHEGRQTREPEFPAELAHLLAGPTALTAPMAEFRQGAVS
jgi:hypothetical protein